MEKIRVWITKYALTEGIKVDDAELCEGHETMISCGRCYFHGNDWHRTPEAAILRAEEMRIKKIATVKKQLAKLEKMTFLFS